MALGIQVALNRLWPLAETGGAPAALSVIEAPHIVAAVLGTVAGAALAAAFAGVRAGRVHPAEGVRYG
jgi:ABC-type lipoprotein release transport system permease subunit